MFEKQLEAFEKFKQLKVGAIFMEMGTGKTKVALDLVNYNNVDLLLYFTPFSTIDNIQTEIGKWNVNCDYEVVGFETLSSSSKRYYDIMEKVKNNKTFIIADESIFIKNPETNRYRRLNKIREHCEYALILNGTPITKNEWDLYYQFNFLSERIFDMTELEFNATFYDKITYKRRYEAPQTFYKLSEVNADALFKKIEPYVFYSKLSLPVRESKEVRMIDIELSEYNESKLQELEQMRNEMTFDRIMALLAKLNHIAACNKEKNNEVAKYIKGKQVIVYCSFLKEIEQISNKVDCYVITGETNKSKRKEIIEIFKHDNKPLLMTFGVGSYSLNLQFCNEIVYSSIVFDYSKVEQSSYRIKRIGQTKDIKYTYILSDCGINKMIHTNISQKQDMADMVKSKIINGGVDEWVKSI